ncbi:MAG: hypothetical protein LBG42_07595, partial [Treponema sp.]|nr:hypothetical protein [Treponema sp.]
DFDTDGIPFTDEYVENAFTVRTAAEWDAACEAIKNGGNNKNYIINVTGTVTIPGDVATTPNFGGVSGARIVLGGGGSLALDLSSTRILLRIGTGQTVILRDITLRGHANGAMVVAMELPNGAFVMHPGAVITGSTNTISGPGAVYVNKGTFTMYGGTISNNNTASIASNYGGGVQVTSTGTFTMSGGTISGNTASSNASNSACGGGVFVDGGTFTMSGGTVSGNRASASISVHTLGGGVYMAAGNFAMSGTAAISGNTTDTGMVSRGGGVYVGGGTFTMSGGEISGNTAPSATADGGGVFVNSTGAFTKEDTVTPGNSGVIYGDDNNDPDDGNVTDNTTANGSGHAVYVSSGFKKRNSTVGAGLNLNSATGSAGTDPWE